MQEQGTMFAKIKSMDLEFYYWTNFRSHAKSIEQELKVEEYREFYTHKCFLSNVLENEFYLTDKWENCRWKIIIPSIYYIVCMYIKSYITKMERNRRE